MKILEKLRHFISDEYGLYLNIYNDYLSEKKSYEKDFAVLCKSDEDSFSLEFKPGKESRLFFNKNKSYIYKNLDKINTLILKIIKDEYISVKLFKNDYLISSLDSDNDLLSLCFNIEYYNPRSNEAQNLEYINKILSSFSELLFLVIQTKENIEFNFEKIESEGLPEGAVKKVPVNKYERSSTNRRLCLQKHGYICNVCNFNFSKTYGEIGDNFIHVHHIVPVSKLKDKGYKINPTKDLVPLCPNCHAMVHKKDPPYTIEELKNILKEIKNN